MYYFLQNYASLKSFDRKFYRKYVERAVTLPFIDCSEQIMERQFSHPPNNLLSRPASLTEFDPKFFNALTVSSSILTFKTPYNRENCLKQVMFRLKNFDLKLRRVAIATKIS